MKTVIAILLLVCAIFFVAKTDVFGLTNNKSKVGATSDERTEGGKTTGKGINLPPMKDIHVEQEIGDIQIDTLKYCTTHDEVGVGGHDLISYFEKNIAEKGSPVYQHTHDGVIYYFINLEHKDLFIKDAEKFLPAFGGWCSMTLAMGRATTPTYDNFKIIDGKLYLFEKTLSINGQTLWNQNPEENKQVARKNYLDYLDDGQIDQD